MNYVYLFHFQLYFLLFKAQACERVCSMDTPKAHIKSGPILILECYKFYFNLLLSLFVNGKDSKLQKRLLQVAKFMCDMFQSFELDSSACKMMLTVTILHLHLGDVILAEQTMLNDHFGSKDYLASKECEVAEEFIQSFKMADVDRLQATQAMVQLNYLEFCPVIQMAKKLSIFQSDDGDETYTSSLSSGSKSTLSSSSSSTVFASSNVVSASNSLTAPVSTCNCNSSGSTSHINNDASAIADEVGDHEVGDDISNELDSLEIELNDDLNNDNNNNYDNHVGEEKSVVESISNSSGPITTSNNDDDDDDVDLS